FTAVAVLVLALGIGVVSGAASLVNVIGLKPAMINEADEVFGVFAMRQEPPRAWRFFSYPEYEEIRDRAGVFSSVAAFDIIDAGVDGGGIGRRGTSLVRLRKLLRDARRAACARQRIHARGGARRRAPGCRHQPRHVGTERCRL